MNKLIFIGDTHGFIKDFNKQKEIIERYNPEFILAEQLQEISITNKDSYIKASKDQRFKEQAELMELCRKRDIKLIGIDFKDFGFDQRIQSIIKGEVHPTKKELAIIKGIVKERSKHHINMIKHFLLITSKPLIVIVGSWHLRKQSQLRKTFKKYLAIYPIDEKGNILTDSRKIENINYLEIIKS